MENELEGLEKWGAHPSEAITRLLGDQLLYRQLIREFCENNDVDLLHFRLKQMDYASAFRIAHNMKGSSASLSLTPLTNALDKLVEDLRPWYENEVPEKNSVSNEEKNTGSVCKTEADTVKSASDDTGSKTVNYSAHIRDRIMYHLRQVDRMWDEYCRFF